MNADDVRKAVEEYGQDRFEDGARYAMKRLRGLLDEHDRVDYTFDMIEDAFGQIEREMKG